MPYVYIVKCNDETFYTGSTWDLEKRLYEHQSGFGSDYTSKKLPIELVFSEYFDSIETAYKREKQIQGWSHKKKEALINRDFIKLEKLSKNYTDYHSILSNDSGH